MKKMLLVLALAMVSFANAQKKGSILVMGSINYQSQNTSNSGSEYKTSYFGFTPKVGYQFHQDWTAGIEAGVGTSKQDNGNNSEYKSNNFSLGGFLRYAKPLNQTFSAYADLGVGYQSNKITNTTGPIDTINEGDGFYIGITPAILVNVGKGFGLNFNVGGLGYNTLNYDGNNGNGDNVKTFNFSFGQQFSVGISKNF
ncbi:MULTISPECIES: outer membrane beta-barrel protein [unclassified Flavobacterium]|uniref:outer membrane beta-barrel protein n=1 Tax=unclassified Flavobacterium TaxID=196869 RepID=UPI000493ABBD|nr:MULTISPECIES: outer membrane beta-barrel protein [unclassified Flavobacterium]MBF4493980.1 outer membrane beta-barrel protein [Flavobacterium sp. MR2016-29]